jgi:hypothetical protein
MGMADDQQPFLIIDEFNFKNKKKNVEMALSTL